MSSSTTYCGKTWTFPLTMKHITHITNCFVSVSVKWNNYHDNRLSIITITTLTLTCSTFKSFSIQHKKKHIATLRELLHFPENRIDYVYLCVDTRVIIVHNFGCNADRSRKDQKDNDHLDKLIAFPFVRGRIRYPATGWNFINSWLPWQWLHRHVGLSMEEMQ